MHRKLAVNVFAFVAIVSAACSSGDNPTVDNAGSEAVETPRSFPRGQVVETNTDAFKVSQAVRAGEQIVVLQEHDGTPDPLSKHAALACSDVTFASDLAACLD